MLYGLPKHRELFGRLQDAVQAARQRGRPMELVGQGDFVEDRQLQAAIHVALGKIGQSITGLSEYGPVLDLPKEMVDHPWEPTAKKATEKKG